MRHSAFYLCLVVLTGCAHTHLRWNTVKQSQSLTEIYEQQVLDNLAMFATNPHAIPHFALPSTGSSDVTDKGSGSGFKFENFRANASFGADRTIKESWSLSPITDPDRLRRMRCAYQRAVGCTDFACDECCEVRKKFLGKPDKRIPIFGKNGDVALDPATGEPYEGTVELVEKTVINEDTGKPELIEVRDEISGLKSKQPYKVLVYQPIVTDPAKLHLETVLVKRRVISDRERRIPTDEFVYVTEEAQGRLSEKRIPTFDCNGSCEVHSCWFKVYKDERCPSCCKDFVGRYKGTSVWVPSSGRDDFGRLVLEILDYALKDPTVKPIVTKEVTLYLDAEGKPSNEEEAFQVVRSEIPITEDNVALEKGLIKKSAFNPNVAAIERIKALGAAGLLNKLSKAADSPGSAASAVLKLLGEPDKVADTVGPEVDALIERLRVDQKANSTSIDADALDRGLSLIEKEFESNSTFNASEDAQAVDAAERIQNSIPDIEPRRGDQFRDQFYRDFELYRSTIFER